MVYPHSVRLIEVGPRDGLQNEPAPVSVAAKVTLIELLAGAGLKTIECGSFVSAKWVPQMAETAEVLKRIRREPGVAYPVLVPNVKGLEAAIAAGVEQIAVFAAASESFSRHNTNCSISESLERLRPVAEAALERNVSVRGYVSCVLGCPYEGKIPLSSVARVSKALWEMGCCEISLGDTIGIGTPLKTQKMIEAVAAARAHQGAGSALS